MLNNLLQLSAGKQSLCRVCPTFDQCAYGCRCLDQDGHWKPVRKTTTFLTTKMALYQQFQLRCGGSHEHCPLEGHAKGSECEPSTWRTISLPLPPFWLLLFWPLRFRRSWTLSAPSSIAAPPAVPERREVPTLDPALASLYEPARPGEDFLVQRRRHERSEVNVLLQVFGRAPNPLRDQARASSYAAPPTDDAESFSQVFEVSDLDASQLPVGWTVDSDGNLQLTDTTSDFWEVRAGCLLRHHVVPRRSTVDVNAFKDVPIEPNLLDPIRTTVMKQPDRQIEVLNDDGTEKRISKLAWTGTTVFQINGEARRELCMFSCHYAKKMGREVKTQMMRQQRKKDKKAVRTFSSQTCSLSSRKMQDASKLL